MLYLLNRCKRNESYLLTSPENHLIFLTNRVGRQLAKLVLSDLEFEGYQPHGSHIGLLADLINKDGQRQQDLAISTIKNKGTVARALVSLETAGMIERKNDPEDRRQKRIFLTEKGRHLWALTESRRAHALDVAAQGLQTEEMKNCTAVLHKIYHNLHLQLSTHE
ncbi:MAG: MarR family transcriptional regulator [Bacteroidota bacterium]